MSSAEENENMHGVLFLGYALKTLRSGLSWVADCYGPITPFVQTVLPWVWSSLWCTSRLYAVMKESLDEVIDVSDWMQMTSVLVIPVLLIPYFYKSCIRWEKIQAKCTSYLNFSQHPSGRLCLGEPGLCAALEHVKEGLSGDFTNTEIVRSCPKREDNLFQPP